MRVTMIGSGYVGLVSGTCLADFGHSVTCIDKDETRIADLQRGQLPIYEPGLDRLVSENVAAGRLGFSTDIASNVAQADVVFIAVGTPSRRGDGHADLSHVESAIREITPHLRKGAVVATKSTVPVGTGDRLEEIIREIRPEYPVFVVSNPEFLRQGAAIEDFSRPDRIVVGVADEAAKRIMADLYRPISINRAPVLFTSRRNAELIKYAGNAFLAMKITFINEMADLCESLGGDVQEVARGIGLDNRIGPKFLHAGPGYGGSCFPKDTLALMRTAQEFGSPMRLIETTIDINNTRKQALAQRVIQACGGTVAGKRIALLGLAFKPNTDDMREAPSIPLAEMLLAAGATVVATDPQAMRNAASLLPDLEFAPDPYRAVEDAEAVVLVTEWNEFRALNFAELAKRMRNPRFIDLRNVYGRAELSEYGFTYHGIGRAAPGERG
ncbi:UDP-glucose/GDP-mannose dehydrogenase family protein [Aureimonas fodinaquatilis]|uniref:UDP-glucose 6-dehydrogenase n=1 Tax=Aureimonas fodinaquatilis TaxID=2565783 RepID=A0A5B0DR70_9HYPH|nr:UDP-glucose/GDP-mannose dehydrogenase family protein [Aureimonas fodinaquatilis]KAA0969006.1 UDP-glucose/GDP-mannose dehydrogenase family protein [Aureimonas fodinaquatilis]